MAILNYNEDKNRDEGALSMPYGIHVVSIKDIIHGTSAKKNTDFLQVIFSRTNENGALEEVKATFFVTDGTLKNDALNPVTNLNHILNKVVNEKQIKSAFDASNTLEILAGNLMKLVNALPEEKRKLKILVLNTYNEDKTSVYPSVGPNRPYTDTVEGNKLRFDESALKTPQPKAEPKSTQQGFAQPGTRPVGAPVHAGAAPQFDEDDDM